MQLRRAILAVAVPLLGFAPAAEAEAITGARYEAPVARYGHFAPGRPHEYARVTVTTDGGRSLALELPEDEVFEDVAPRLVKLAANEPAEILAIVSRRRDGSRIAMIRLNQGRLEVSAESPAIGVPMRWLNPVAVSDLDGDGNSEIAIVTTPHVGGTLRVYRRTAKRLVEIAALAGFSNHVYGSPELGLSASASLFGRVRLLVPDANRRQLRIMALEGSRLVEAGRCALPAPAIGAIEVISPSDISVGLTSGRHRVLLDACLVN